MTHRDKISDLAAGVLDAQSTIKLAVKALLNEDNDTAQESVGALSLCTEKLQTVLEGLQEFPRDLSEKQLTTP